MSRSKAEDTDVDDGVADNRLDKVILQLPLILPASDKVDVNSPSWHPPSLLGSLDRLSWVDIRSAARIMYRSGELGVCFGR